MSRRSKPSAVSRTRQPPPGSPSRLASGTRAPSRKTSLNSAPPVTCLIGRTSTPGWRMGNQKNVSPWCLGTSQSERATSSPWVACPAPEVHTFWPVITQSSPSRSARVWTAARSEPAPGSL